MVMVAKCNDYNDDPDAWKKTFTTENSSMVFYLGDNDLTIIAFYNDQRV